MVRLRMFKWTPYLTGFAIGGFMGSYWGAGDTIGGIMFSESSPTNLRSSVTCLLYTSPSPRD